MSSLNFIEYGIIHFILANSIKRPAIICYVSI